MANGGTGAGAGNGSPGNPLRGNNGNGNLGNGANLAEITRLLNQILNVEQQAYNRNRQSNNNSGGNNRSDYEFTRREQQSRIENIKNLKNQSEAYKAVNKSAVELANTLKNKQDELKANRFDEALNKINAQLNALGASLEQDERLNRQSSYNKKREITNAQVQYKREFNLQSRKIKEEERIIRGLRDGLAMSSNLSDVARRSIEAEISRRESVIDGYNDIIDASKRHIDDLEQEYKEELAQKEAIAQVRKESLDRMNEMISMRTNINSSLQNYFDTDSTKRIREFKSSFIDFFTPKQGAKYKNMIDELDKEVQQLAENRNSNADAILDINTAISGLTSSIAENEAELQRLTNEGADINSEEVKKIKTEQKRLQDELAINKEKKESLQKEQDLIDEQLKTNEELRENVNKQTNMTSNVLKKVGSTLKSVIEAGISRELDLLQNAADKAFSTFEQTQKTLGKTLKLSTGGYQDYIKELQNLADEMGVAIDSTQLSELSATLAEFGIADTNLMKSLAAGQAMIAETGSSLKFNEDMLNQFQSQFFKQKQSLMTTEDYTEEQASEKAREQLDTTISGLIGAENAIAKTFGSTSALRSGGSEQILNLASQLIGTGTLQEEDLDKFYLSLGGAMQAAVNAGLDPDAILSKIDTIMNSTMSDLSAEDLSFLMTNEMDTERFIEEFVKNAGGTVIDMAEHTATLYKNMDSTVTAYAKGAYGSNMTNLQIKNLQANAEQIQSNFENADLSNEALEKSVNQIRNDIKKGTYLTATETQEKYQIAMMDEVALIYQKIPDGQWLMDQSLSQGKKLINDVADLALSAAGSFLGTRMGFGGSNGGSGGGGDGGPGGGGGGTGSGMNALLGGAGLAVSGYSLVQSYKEGEDISDALTDSTFTAGLGMALGGALGGPVGAAIGGAAGATLIPAAEKGLEKWLNDTDPFGIMSDSGDKAFQDMLEASNQLKLAATDLSNSATQQIEALEAEEKANKNASEQEKKAWLLEHKNDFTALGIDVQNLLDDSALTTSEGIKKAYDAISKEYYEKAKAKGEKLVGAAELGTAIGGVFKTKRGLTDTSMTNEAVRVSEDDLNSQLASGFISEEEYNEGIKAVRESQAQQLAAGLAGEGALESFTNIIDSYIQDIDQSSPVYKLKKKFLSDEGYKNFLINQAMSQYAKDLGGEAAGYDQQKIDILSSAYSSIADSKTRYEETNKAFQEVYKKAHENAGNDNITDIIAAFNALSEEERTITKNGKEYYLTEADLASAIRTDGSLLYSTNTYTGLPSLDTDDGRYRGYKTGLDYVPMDNYLALLHQGETVLNATEADEYRAGNTINISDITSTMVSQTDRIENMLSKIYNVLITFNSGKRTSGLNKNIVNMVSDIYST